MRKALRLVQITGWVLIAAAIAVATAAYIQSTRPRAPQQQSLPVLDEVPNFRFSAHDGSALSLQDLQGKVWIANFFFTSCTSVCPPMQANMKQVQDAFAQVPGVKLVSFTVDPERDTVQALQDYSELIGALPDKWFFLTGEKGTIYRLARQGFKLAVDDTPQPLGNGVHEFLHSEKLVLVDSQGRIRGYYSGTDPSDVQRLINDMRLLLDSESAR